MDCKGKILNALGDSITWGALTSDPPRTSFCNLLQAKLDLKEVRNYGSPGTHLASYQREDGSWCGGFYKRAHEMEKDADIILVFGGTNDFGQGNAPLGQFSDRTDRTFYGANHLLMEYLLETYPTAVTVIMTPTRRRDEDNPKGNYGQKPVAMGTLADYVAIIKEVANYYSLPVLDLYSMSGMQLNHPVIGKLYSVDQLHFNDLGQDRLADRVAAFLKSY